MLNPPGEPEPVGYRALAPVDRFLQTYRVQVIGGTVAVALIGAPLLYFLTFDFDPLHLRSPKTESISTLIDLGTNPQVGFHSVNVVLPSLSDAVAAAARLKKLPQVGQPTTLQSLVPQDQDKKLEMIKEFAEDIEPILDKKPAKPPTDAENIAALNGLAEQLNKFAGNAKGPGAEAARRLAADSTKLAQAAVDVRGKVQTAFIMPLQADSCAVARRAAMPRRSPKATCRRRSRRSG